MINRLFKARDDAGYWPSVSFDYSLRRKNQPTGLSGCRAPTSALYSADRF